MVLVAVMVVVPVIVEVVECKNNNGEKGRLGR